jgi:hypothetical protein
MRTSLDDLEKDAKLAQKLGQLPFVRMMVKPMMI